MKNRLLAGIALGALALALTACVAEPPGGTTPSAVGSTAPVAETDATTLTVASNADQLKTLDRFSNFGFGGDDTGNLWGDPLVTSDHHQNYEPALATKWEMSADGLAWTFTLRESVVFSSGNPFTSADVQATFDRLITDKTLTDAGAWGSYEKTDASDPNVAVIHLTGVMPTFLDEIGRVPIIDSVAFAADPAGYFLKPSGTGAFPVSAFDTQTGEIQFTKNEAWWGWTDSNKTTVDKIIYQIVLDDSTRAAALQSGSVDIATQIAPDTAAGLDPAQFTVITVPMDTHIHIAYQTESGKAFSNKDLREALSLSIDRKGLVDGILSGAGVVSDWPIPQDNLGYEAGHEYAYDVDKAKSLVAGSGYDGKELDMILTTSSFPRATEIAQAIQGMAAEAGIKLKVETLENATFNERRSAGDYDICLGSFAATAGDPQVEAAVIIAFDIFGTHYDSQEIKDLAASVSTITDRAERGEVLKEIFAIEMENFSPFVYLYSQTTFYGTTPSVKDYTVYADGSANYKFVTKG